MNQVPLNTAVFESLLNELERQLRKSDRFVLAIDGCCGSGKTTLAAYLAAQYGCTVFHMDDYFLRPEQRTPERLAEPGGNVDRERFHTEILLPLEAGEEITYRPYHCETGTLLPPVTIRPTAFTVIEGSYAMHPLLAPSYTFSVFLDLSPALQAERIRRRNPPALAERFFREWIPMENRYFETFRIREGCSLYLPVDKTV